ncbi:hypothetical protein D0Y60_01820 [Shinella sp. WSJ-2]|uniref:hypothetical protein n=1 Tax=Shinella sp. WSJ-2 TaxID=2303749 RepID=UPI000E3B7C61|nr:hypothetical protein [Shinella sp. WSJ-2]RFZ89392.1 hypothetical protein D0Y60_01820 [Shinella sp. WSJ-2]
MTDLTSLIEKLEKAEGASRGLDAEISAVVEPHLFDAPGFTPIRPIPNFRYDSGENVIRFEGGGLMDVHFFPPATSSIDAAVSLAERLLPGWMRSMLTGLGKTSAYVRDKSILAPDKIEGEGYHATPAIALVLATLRALQQKDSSNG